MLSKYVEHGPRWLSKLPQSLQRLFLEMDMHGEGSVAADGAENDEGDASSEEEDDEENNE
jgi:hypothetical protein